jgi:hypothetical protein
LSPLYFALFARWAVAYWAVQHGRVYVSDWDESNAFCNTNREDVPALLADSPALHCGDAIDWFYSSFDVHVQTPHGLTEPYTMTQGGAQGDSMGVGTYMIFRVLRARALRTAVSGPLHPCLPGVEVPEIIYADDGRQFGLTAAELGDVISASARLATESGASVNATKLKTYCIGLTAAGLEYLPATVPTTLGHLSTESAGLSAVGVPLVMGDSRYKAILKTVGMRAVLVLRAVRRHHPSCILTLRVLLAYAISILDYKLALVPVPTTSLQPLQCIVRQIARGALSLPDWFPGALLVLPLRFGGMGFPVLAPRLTCRRIQITTDASQCRSVLTRELVKGLLYHPVWSALPSSDPSQLGADLEEHGLTLLLDPPKALAPTPLTFGEGPAAGSDPGVGPYLVVSDGACCGHRVGYAAILLNTEGIIRVVSGASLIDDASSWIAEWLAKLLAAELSRGLSGGVCFVADNTAVTVGNGALSPSGSDVVDRIIRHVASLVQPRPVLEGYLPAEHDTHWISVVASAQRQADLLAKASIEGDVAASLPYLGVTAPHTLLLRDGRVCIRARTAVTAAYDRAVSQLPGIPPLPVIGYGGHVWEALVTRTLIPTAVIRSALWLRSAAQFSVVPAGAYCPFCCLSVAHWASHFTDHCPRVLLATATAFITLLRTVQGFGWTFDLVTPWQACCTTAHGDTVPVQLGTDQQLQCAATGTLCCTWSGLVWLQGAVGDDSPALTLTQCQDLAVQYLQALHLWLHRDQALAALIDHPWYLTPGHDWGLETALSVVFSLARAACSVGATLCGPPWQPPPRAATVLLWQQPRPASADDVHFLHLYRDPAPPPPAGVLGRRLQMAAGLWIEWDQSGEDDPFAQLATALLAL